MATAPLPLAEQATLEERHANEDLIVNLDHMLVFPGGNGAGVRASDFVAAEPTTIPSKSSNRSRTNKPQHNRTAF